MADVLEIHPTFIIVVVAAFPAKITFPQTSQSPAVSEIEVIFAGVAVVKAVDDEATTLDTNSPTLPAFASLFVVVP